MGRRRCCCAAGDACIIWEYNPTAADIGQPVDPPWQVSGAGSWEVVDGTGAGGEGVDFDAVLEVTGPLKFYHRTPHRDRHFTGKLWLNFSFPTTDDARYRLLYNAVKSGDTIGASEYFVLEWIPFVSGGEYNNERILKVDEELFNHKNDAPLWYKYQQDYGSEPDNYDTNLPVIFRCQSVVEGVCEAECEHCKDEKAPDVLEMEIAGMAEGTCGDCPNLDGKYRVTKKEECLWETTSIGGNCDPASATVQITEAAGVYTMTASLGNHTWTKTFDEKPDCCVSHQLTHATSSGDCDSSGATCIVSPPEDSEGDTISMAGNYGHVCEEPYEDGWYVGFEIPDNVTVKIMGVLFAEVEDTYSGGDIFCRTCPCHYCGGSCLETWRPMTATYESSCPTIDGHTLELLSAADLDIDPLEFKGSYCGAWYDNSVPTVGLGYICGAEFNSEWTTDPIVLTLSRTHQLSLPPYDFDLSEWNLHNIGSAQGVGEDGPEHPNENSTCDPFYLEFGPFPLYVVNPADPPIDQRCTCSPCDLEDCDWFKVIITMSP